MSLTDYYSSLVDRGIITERNIQDNYIEKVLLSNSDDSQRADRFISYLLQHIHEQLDCTNGQIESCYYGINKLLKEITPRQIELTMGVVNSRSKNGKNLSPISVSYFESETSEMLNVNAIYR